MCGIFGHYSSSLVEDSAMLKSRLFAAQRSLHHRGPDDRGFETYSVVRGTGVPVGTLSLGHTRLSIIDLSPGGHQPMNTPDGRYTIVFNGEIYNYRELRQELSGLGHSFFTESDTEVLLAAWARWGAEGLRKLIGMFAFAVFDRQAQTLTLVRDAFGIKPLYYRQQSNGYTFASELPALLAMPGTRPRLNLQRTYDFLVWGSYDDQAATFFEGVVKLQPGHWLEIPLTSRALAAPVRWWWPSIAERTDLSFEQAARQLREMFLDNIRLHLRSDVPLGAALSGGVDSSAVVCAMRHIEPDLPIHTFTFVARGSAVDEELWADLINSHVGAIVHKIAVSPEEMVADLDDMILAQGEPFGSTSIYAQYRVFRLAREQGITVTLDGQGADEMLAGYRGYPHARMRSLIERGEFGRLMKFIRGWSQWPGRELKESVRMGLRQVLPAGVIAALKRRGGHLPPDWLDISKFTSRGVNLLPPDQAVAPPDAHRRQLSNALRNALTVSGLESLLRHGDRNSMRWSIESRVPFLTTDIAEYLLSLPEDYLISTSGETKSIFRSAMRGIVPDGILDRKDKVGFATPEQDWLRGIDVKAWLSTDAVERIPFLRLPELRQHVQAEIDGRLPFTAQSWRLLNFCRWFELTSPTI